MLTITLIRSFKLTFNHLKIMTLKFYIKLLRFVQLFILHIIYLSLHFNKVEIILSPCN
mgnify:CR=1 FL=1